MRDNLVKILIVTKYRFIGDTLTAIPTFRAVKERWPNSEVSLLSGARACELMQNCPYIDRYFEFDPYRSSDKGIRQYPKLVTALRIQNFDIALVLNRSFHSALTAALGGAKKRVGWSGFEGRDFMLNIGCTYDRDKAEIECFLDVFRAAAGEVDCIPNLQLWLDDREIAEATEHLPQGDFLVGIQPGATHEYKQWPRASFVSVCEHLVERNDRVRVILVGGGDEEAIAQAFLVDASPKLAGRVTNLVGRLSLRTTLGVVSLLHGFIGNDTAIRHAAVALDIPSVGLFGPTSKSKWGNASPPRHVVVSSTTGKMEDISVDSVLAESSRWFDNAPTPVSAGARYE